RPSARRALIMLGMICVCSSILFYVLYICSQDDDGDARIWLLCSNAGNTINAKLAFILRLLSGYYHGCDYVMDRIVLMPYALVHICFVVHRASEGEKSFSKCSSPTCAQTFS